MHTTYCSSATLYLMQTKYKSKKLITNSFHLTKEKYLVTQL